MECATALSRVRLFGAHLTRALLSSQVGSAYQRTSMGSGDDMRGLFRCLGALACVGVADSLEMAITRGYGGVSRAACAMWMRSRNASAGGTVLWPALCPDPSLLAMYNFVVSRHALGKVGKSHFRHGCRLNCGLANVQIFTGRRLIFFMSQ